MWSTGIRSCHATKDHHRALRHRKRARHSKLFLGGIRHALRHAANPGNSWTRGLATSTSINAGVIDAYPECAEAMLKASWEFIGHGMHQKSMQGEDDEASLIMTALDKLESFTGVKPRGWLSPGLKETLDTPDILKSLGIDCVWDWMVGDLPAWMTTKNGP